jgi:hypothetical protein
MDEGGWRQRDVLTAVAVAAIAWGKLGLTLGGCTMVATRFELLGELEEELEEEALELEPLFSRERAPGQRFGDREWRAVEFEGPKPRIKVTCPACAACDPLLRDAIREAIKLANNAASKLDAAAKVAPRSRDKKAQETARLFRAFFCHDPSLKIPWANNAPSGANVAVRLRAVARELGGGRTVSFLCLPTRDPCADADRTCCDPTTDAWSLPGDSTIRLCERFWNRPNPPGLPAVYRRASTIIHEMLHVLFGAGREGRRGGLLDSDPKRANANCYEAFVLRVNGFGGDPVSVRGCGPC